MKHLWNADRYEGTYCDICGIKIWQSARSPDCTGTAAKGVRK